MRGKVGQNMEGMKLQITKARKQRIYTVSELFALVTRTGIELIRTPDAVFSKMRKSPILRRFRAMQL